MSFTKEKTKLTNILKEVAEIDNYNEESWIKITELATLYSSILNGLYKKKPNVFGNLYKYNIAEIKYNKKMVKESFSDTARQTNFIVYKDSIVESIDSAIEYIVDYI